MVKAMDDDSVLFSCEALQAGKLKALCAEILSS